MKSELIVDVQPDETAIALTEDDRLMEVSREVRQEQTFAVGNIYYGRVKKVMPALNAVFVDVGFEKEAFLHYLDLGSQFLTIEKFTQFAVQNPKRRPSIDRTPVQPEVGKQGNIADVCRVGQEILVQVTKEPINTKGPRLTAEISLAGRNIVLIPFGEKVMVSSKIRSEGEKSRLKQLVQVIKPAHFGVIVRTQAEGKRAAELDAELKLLLRRWEETVTRLQKAKPVSVVTEEIGRTIGVIRDIFTPEYFTAIHVNDELMYEEVREYVSLIAPEAENIVHLYKSAEPIFDHFQVTRQMKTGLGRTVGFKNGGYLIMERTEALFSIDVNSGSKKLGADQEDNAFKCNMLAADEIAHQLRLRDIGGIIIVDFIDMDSAEHRQQLFEHMRKLMKRDRARHNVLQLSKFGLMQITRQRVRPAVEMDVHEECPTCHGKGHVEPSILFTEKLEQECQRYMEQFGRGLTLRLHPFIFAYVEKGFFWNSLKWLWRRKYGVKVVSSEMLGMLEYRFLDTKLNPLLIPEKAVLTVDQKEDAKAKIYATKQIQEKPEVILPEEKSEEQTPKQTPVKQQKDAKKADKPAEQKPKDKPAKQSAEQPLQKANKQEEPKLSEQPTSDTEVATELTESTPATITANEQAEQNAQRSSKKKRKKKTANQSPSEAMPQPEPAPIVAEEVPVAEEVAADSQPVMEQTKPVRKRKKASKATDSATKEEQTTPTIEPEQDESKEKQPKKARTRKKKESETPVEPETTSEPAKKRAPRKRAPKKPKPTEATPSDSAN